MFSRLLDDSYDIDVRRSISSLTAAKVGANSAVRFAPPFIATIASGLGVNLTTLGTAIAVGELSGLSGPLITRIAGGVTRRSALCIGLLGIALGASLAATSTSVIQFAAGLVLMTMSKLTFDVGVISWLTDRVSYNRIGRVVGLTETAWAGGLFIGVVLMGLLTGLTSWRWGYVLAVVAVVCLAALLRRRLPDEQPPARLSRAEHRDRAPLGAGRLVVFGTFALAASSQSIFVTFGKWLENDFGFSDTKVAVVVFCLGGIELIAATSTVRFADRWGKQRSTMYGSLVMVPAAALLAILHATLAPALIVMALFICAFEFSIIATLSLASSLIPGRPSTGLGFMVAAATLGRGAVSPLATAVYTHSGMSRVAIIGAICAAGSAMCQWRYRTLRIAT
ncbi:MAG: MFS transporter [Ilumatobacteraceae bacterium]